MLDVPTGDISARINAIVRNFVKVGAPNGEIRPDRNLEFDLTIPGSKLMPANFRSIERVAALVEELTR
jgi:hypothetical protein